MTKNNKWYKKVLFNVEGRIILKKELGIYLHIPFCVQKCRYCDFLSFPAEEEIQVKYVKKMEEEIRRFPQKERWTIKTIFFGGGTPSILGSTQIIELMQVLKEEFSIEKDAEISIECNPGTVDKEKLYAYGEAGINRISFGLQSSDARELKLLGRIHTYETFLESYEMARTCGFYNINVDLMSALPGQTVQSWNQTLKNVLDLNPEHISAYSLMIEEGTPFYDLYEKDLELREAGKPCRLLPSEEEERRMYYDAKRMMEEYGYFRYEISNYAKQGYECRHNIRYWERKDYAGFGIGAAELIENIRFKNTCNLKEYMEGQFKKEKEVVDQKAQMEEFWFLGLRMMKGVSAKAFFEQFGLKIEDLYAPVLNRLMRQELIHEEKGVYRLTDLGIDVSNYVLAQFL